MKSNDALIAVAYCGDHYKMRQGHIGEIAHANMLMEAIRNVNPDSEFDVLVSANKFSVMDIADTNQRLHAWQIYNLAFVTSLRENHGHQMGQAWAIKQALEYADIRGFPYMFWTAEDVLYDNPFLVREMVNMMKAEGLDYIGRHWGSSAELDCQVFACRVKAFSDCKTKQFVFNPPDFAARGGYIEPYMYDIVMKHKLKHKIHFIHHHHEHNPDKFMEIVKYVKGKQAEWRKTVKRG